MGITDTIREMRQKPGPGVLGEPPKDGIKRFWFVITTNTMKLIYLSLLYILFCIPLITVPAALSGLYRVAIKLARDGHAFVWSDFWGEFKTDFLKRSVGGLIILAIPVLLTYSVSGLLGYNVGLGISIVLGVVFFLIQSYLYPLLAILNVPYGSNVRNAILLSFKCIKHDLLLLVCSCLPTVAAAIWFPITLPVILIALPSVTALATCVIIKPCIAPLLIE